MSAQNPLNELGHFVSDLLGRAMQPQAPLDDSLKTLNPRVLILNFDPIVNPATGERLAQRRNWNRIDDLVAGYSADVSECSGGLVNYQVVDRIVVDEFPEKIDGFRYNAASYLAQLDNPSLAHQPDEVNYQKIVDQFHLIQRVANNEFDEVWMFGAPSFGFYESRMVGRGAFWCNAPELPNTTGRRFVMMGFSYERGVGEMLEDLGHRAESVLGRVFHAEGFLNWAYNEKRNPAEYNSAQLASTNLFARFICFDQVAPQHSNVGVMHFAPSSQHHYEWGNPNTVLSCCDDWLRFPNLPNPPNYRPVNCADWGGGEIRAHHKWWFKRMPKVTGHTNGILNNWWYYFIKIDQPFFDHH